MRLRAPQEDGAVVAEPPLSAASELLEANGFLLGRAQPIPGWSWTELRSLAQREVLAAARAYHVAAGEPAPGDVDPDAPLVLAGHQPELFHPGVWLKNFALAGLSRQTGAVALNLVVDNDIPRSTALAVPAVDRARSRVRAQLQSVPWDARRAEAPYEEQAVHDEARFADLPERVAALTADWGYRPFLADFWPEVLRQAQRTPLVGERFAAARRSWERRWGCSNLEVPVGAMCDTTAFLHFARVLLDDLPRFHATYNECVHTYRRRHGLRSRHHPVPDLATQGDWFEAPLWAWRPGEGRRGRLFARQRGGVLGLRSGKEVVRTEPDGLKIRARALLTTIFARLFVGDLFVHGIGGGKYDELSDDLIRRYFGVEPPRYLVLSGTLLLPLPKNGVGRDDCRRAQQAARDLSHNPQRHLAPDGPTPEAAALLAERRAWVDQEPTTRRGRRERFRRLRELTERLQPFVADDLAEANGQLAQYREAADSDAVLRRRDYAFCLFPEEKLRGWYEPFLT